MTNYFDRQQRIDWWQQEKLTNSRVLVVGAGALGNEVVKNLALLGIGQILIIDFDIIEAANLSKSVFFRKEDINSRKSKAEIVAQRAQPLNHNPEAIISWYNGDVVWDVGIGVFRHADIVVCCLDNYEARIAVSLNCWRTKKTWIDGGILGMAGNVSIYDSSEERACFECSLTSRQYNRAKIRYSCVNNSLLTQTSQGFEPTTLPVAALVAALQSQEVVKILHGLPSFVGKQMVFHGTPRYYTEDGLNPMRLIQMPINPHCYGHQEDRCFPIIELPEVSVAETTLKQLVFNIESNYDYEIDYIELDREVITQIICSTCDRTINVNIPNHLLNLEVIRCPTCGFIDYRYVQVETFHKIVLGTFLYQQVQEWLLSKFGIPPLHILKTVSKSGEISYFELSGDLLSIWK